MHLSQVSLQDWVSLIAGVLGVLSAVISRQHQLPPWARKWLKKVGVKRIELAIETAAGFANASAESRKAKAVSWLKQNCKDNLDIELPTSIANLLVEFVYQQWKRANR